MRVLRQSVFRWPRPVRAGGPILLYGMVITGLCMTAIGLADALVRQAEAPVAKLMSLGDAVADQQSSANASSAATASAVLESDAWMQNVKSQFQAKDRAKGSQQLPGSSGLFGKGGQELLTTDPPESLDEGGSRRASKIAAHRTVCVRLCDGYFWPISYATSDDNFERDQAACERSCSSPAKLYVYENRGQDLQQMVNLKGQPYTKLSTAFQFRTQLDQSCKCKPHPWEQEATDRHRKYAEDAAKKKSMRQAALDTSATTPAKTSKGAKGIKNAKLAEPTNSKPEQKAETVGPGPAVASNISIVSYAVLNAPPEVRGDRAAVRSTPITPGPATIAVGKPAVSTGIGAVEIYETMRGAAKPAKAEPSVKTSAASTSPTPRRAASQQEVAPAKEAALRIAGGQVMRLGTNPPATRVALQSAQPARDWRIAVFASH